MTKDLRTISIEERKALRAMAVGEVRKHGNVSQVSRDIGISRQVLHGWLNEFKNRYNSDEGIRGRPEQKLYKSQVRQILEILSHKLPSDLGIDSIFWSVSSVRKLIGKTLDINASAYLVRKWLLEWGFFTGRNAGLLEMSASVASKGVSIRKFAELCDMPCYVFWRSSVWMSKESHYFQCVSSERGDIRFVGDKCDRMGRMDLFLNKLQKTDRKNIVVVYDKNNTFSEGNVFSISKSVILFRLSKGKLKGLTCTKSRTKSEILAFLQS